MSDSNLQYLQQMNVWAVEYGSCYYFIILCVVVCVPEMLLFKMYNSQSYDHNLDKGLERVEGRRPRPGTIPPGY